MPVLRYSSTVSSLTKRVVALVTVPLAMWGSFAPLAAAAGYGAALWYACRQLGGMSGDVSGFALTLGELCGLAVLTLVR